MSKRPFKHEFVTKPRGIPGYYPLKAGVLIRKGDKYLVQTGRIDAAATSKAIRPEYVNDVLNAHYRKIPGVEPVAESIDHPVHYGGKDDPYECIKVIEAWDLGFCLGNVVKYINRAGKKDPTKTKEDLEKALWYLNRELQRTAK